MPLIDKLLICCAGGVEGMSEGNFDPDEDEVGAQEFNLLSASKYIEKSSYASSENVEGSSKWGSWSWNAKLSSSS